MLNDFIELFSIKLLHFLMQQKNNELFPEENGTDRFHTFFSDLIK